MKITYRPEIDGLRTLSVFAVILYHANFTLYSHSLFQGGFIGVDIFFVITGYLITTLILKEIYQTNNFSFKYFYERRIRRILPVLLFVVTITSIISFFILLPLSLINFAKSILSIFSFSSNFYFYYTENSYGTESSLLIPLLHVWSLSVEQQFYILFPIFLIFSIKFFKRKFFTILFYTFLISLFFTHFRFFLNFNDLHSFNYYMLSSRAFEFLIGSLLSYFELNNRRNQKSYSILNQICPTLGIILIVYAFIYLKIDKIYHPGFITLIPLIGVSLIIWFSKKGELVTEILSSKIFVFFGLISYSLYLWHYPVFAFLRYIEVFDNSVYIKLLAILLTIIISTLSYYFIERTFRNKNIISKKILATSILIGIIILLGYSFYVIKTQGIKNRFPSIIGEQLIGERFSIKEKDYSKILKRDKFKQNVFLIGDSHAESLQYNLSKQLKKINYNFFPFTTFDAYYLYVQNFQPSDSKNNLHQKHIQKNKDIEKLLSQEKGLVIIHQRWAYQILELGINYKPFGISISSKEEQEKYLITGVKSAIETILNQGHTLVLVYPVPEMDFDVPKLALKNYLTTLEKINSKNKNIDIQILTSDYYEYKNRNKIIFETLDSIQMPNVHRVYPHKSFCNATVINKCVANNKEHLFYYDNNHLSLEGSKYIVNDIMKVIQQVEIDKKINK